MQEKWSNDTQGHVRELVEKLHELWFDEDKPLMAVDEDLERWEGVPEESVPALIERLRYVTDNEYAECAYGCE